MEAHSDEDQTGHGTTTRKEKAKQRRNLRSCPVPGCRVETLKLAQHLQKSKAPGHSLGQKAAQALAKSTGRFPRTHKGRLRKFCSVAGCDAYIVDIPHHMRTVHKTPRPTCSNAGDHTRHTPASSISPQISPKASSPRHTPSPQAQPRKSDGVATPPRPTCSPPTPSPEAPTLSAEAQPRNIDGVAMPLAYSMEARTFYDEHMRTVHKKPRPTGTQNAGQHGSRPPPPSSEVTTPSMDICKSGKLAYNLDVRRFYDFLLSLEGGCKSPKNATQYCRTVQTYWNSTGTESLDGFSIDRVIAFFKARYAEVTESNVAPGTVRSEITCVISYLRYAIIQGLDIPNAYAVIDVCHNLSKSLRFAVAERRGTRAEKDFQTAILPPFARRYFETSPYVERIISALNGELKPSDATLSQARGVFMVLISISIGSRISALVNMTAKNVQTAVLKQPADKPPCRIIGVVSHKTTVSRGPAEIPVATDVWRTLNRFIDHTGASGETPVFRDSHGRGYHKNVSNATYHVRHVWKASGAEAKFGPYSITRARKSLTSTAREHDPGLADPVADVLMHSRHTADRYYMLADRKRVAAETFGSLQLVQAAREKQAKADTV